jgi:hypothetical protein
MKILRLPMQQTVSSYTILMNSQAQNNQNLPSSYKQNFFSDNKWIVQE